VGGGMLVGGWGEVGRGSGRGLGEPVWGERGAPAGREQGIGLELARRLGAGLLVHDGSSQVGEPVLTWPGICGTPATVNPLTSNGNRFEMRPAITPAGTGRRAIPAPTRRFPMRRLVTVCALAAPLP